MPGSAPLLSRVMLALTAPVIAGVVKIGQTLTLTPGVFVGAVAFARTYQWKRNGVSIGGATGTTYAPVAADIGLDSSGAPIAITCVETATNGGGGSASATSNSLSFAESDVAAALILRSTSGLTLSGSSVTDWADTLSGSGLVASQGTASKRPTNLGSLNGKVALDFDGADDDLANTIANLLTAGAARTIFAVARSDTSGGGGLFMARLSNKYDGHIEVVLAGTHYAMGNGVDAGQNVVVSGAPWAAITSNHQVTWRCTGSGNAPTVRLNRAAVTVASGTQGTEDGTTGWRVGATTVAAVQFWNGVIGEVRVYASALSADDISTIEAVLQNYWGL